MRHDHRFRPMRLRTLVVIALALAPSRATAQPAPYHRYRTLETQHFRVHVAAGLEREGRVAGAAAEHAYAQLSRELVPPRGTIDLVVSDDADYSNGFATPLPTNRIVVLANPPLESGGLRLNEDWLALVVTHELTHIFHLDRTRGIWSVAQSVFGRAPFLFPNMYGPAWLTEGLAVYYESRLTEGGRLKSSQERLLARASAMESRLPRLNELSLSSPRFPGGEGAYAYGSLFIEYLARTRGDSAVGAFVERQSGQLIPLWLNRAAVQGFGISFADAFDAWRDSVIRSVRAPTPPMPGWRELTTHGYYASNPRWLDDTTVVYVGTDGRETNAAYAVTLGRRRTRIGRRDGRGANVPLADGSLLYSQLDFTAPAEIRSDLYRERDGHVTRLTHGQRLVEPDARSDGSIVAAQLAPARARLVLLATDGRLARVLREAGPDETWSEPRWSPDGNRIAVVHRAHGGAFSLEVIDVRTPDVAALVLERAPYVIASPSWTRDGEGIVFVRDDSIGSQLALLRVRRADTLYAVPRSFGSPIYTPDVGPDGRLIAAVTLHADGYHVGSAPTPAPRGVLSTGASDSRTDLAATDAVADTQPRAPGEYRDYSAWNTVLPRYWYPLIESAPVRGMRLGAMTTGSDVIGRHSYSAYAAVPTTGRFVVGGFFYRYAGFRRPLLDVNLSQDWTSLGTVYSVDQGGNVIGVAGSLLKRTRDLSLAATFERPRVRTYSSVILGTGVERRDFATDPEALLARLDTSLHTYTFPRAFVGAVWTNVQRPPLSVSPEDGVTLALTARERIRSDAPSRTASLSVVGTASGYKSLDLPGFAHHVLALRLAGGYSDRRSGTSLEVGGTSGSTIDVVPGYTVGEGRRTFGVRGFPAASVYGTQAVAASLEYRAPLVLGGRGLALLPLFFDRSSLTAFADVGTASCASQPLYVGICSPPAQLNHPLASIGGELNLSAAVLEWDVPTSFRLGVAVPVANRDLVGARRASAYVAFGLSF